MGLQCRVPGCGAGLKANSRSGVCFDHRHSVYCRCVQCLARDQSQGRGVTRKGDDAQCLAIGEPDFSIDISAAACRQMWAAVLMVWIEDCLATGESRYPNVRQQRCEARSLFAKKGFRDVCWLAGLDADAVVDRLTERVASAERAAR